MTKKAKGEEITAKGVLYDIVAGQIGGSLGERIGKSRALASPTNKDLTVKVERARRMASPTKANGTLRRIGRPEAKQRKAGRANAVREAFVDGNATRGGIVGGGLAGGVVEGLDKLRTKNQDRKKK